RNFIFLGLLGIVTVIFLYIIKTFAYPLLWAAIIAGIFYPVYSWLTAKLKYHTLSAGLTLILVFLVIIIPLSLITSLLIKESVDIYNTADNNSSQIKSTLQNSFEWIKNNPLTAKLQINENFWLEKLSEIAKTSTAYIFTTLKAFTQNSLVFLLMFAIMLYALFFFLRDGDKMLKKMTHLCPLGDKYEKMLYKRFISTARATLKGTIIVGSIQALLGGLLFYYFGIQGVVIWTLVMFFLAIIPGIGCSPVWFLAGLILLITGQTWQGLTMWAVGFLIISTVDNILRPVLVGKDTQMHPLLVFLSTLGGIAVFGISGFIIGPIITALLLSFWEMYEEYYKNELDHN
ncbi:MAG: AI-2E family transporter, partial [Candidatus Komeilibacteria bacterium]|nr:AI-2E family transporter [Candidatus Komeilibacteria bacterium]